MALGDEDNRSKGGANKLAFASRSERKSLREKRRRNELNKALDSLACILRIINPDMECSYLSQNDLSYLPKKKMKSDTCVNITNRVDLIKYAAKVLKQFDEEKEFRSLGISDLKPRTLQNTSLLTNDTQRIGRYRSLRNSLGPLAAASMLENADIHAHGVPSPHATLPLYDQSNPSLQSISKMYELLSAGLPSVSDQDRSHGMPFQLAKRQKLAPIAPTSGGLSFLQTQMEALSESEIAASQLLARPLELQL